MPPVHAFVNLANIVGCMSDDVSMHRALVLLLCPCCHGDQYLRAFLTHCWLFCSIW